MDSMTSEYLYPILLNRVSDQGYTNTLSDKKKRHWATLPVESESTAGSLVLYLTYPVTPS